MEKHDLLQLYYWTFHLLCRLGGTVSEFKPAEAGEVLWASAEGPGASRQPGEKVMSSRQMSPFGLRPTWPSKTT